MKIILTNPPFFWDTKRTQSELNKIYGWNFNKNYRKYPFIYSLWTKIRNRNISYGVRAGSRWPWSIDVPIPPLHYPFIMAYAASYLQKNNIDIELIDAVAEENYSYSNYLNQIKNLNPDIVLIESSMPSFDIDIWVAKQISEFAEVCFAGPHIQDNAKDIQKRYPFITYLLKGEYILSSLKMAKTKKRGVYESEIVRDLDKIPYPYRDYPEAIKYFDPSMPTKQPQLQIYGSKGCPFNCSYCLWTQTMYKHITSYRNPENISNEIIYCVKKYGYKSIFFDDDTFNIGTDRISKLCDKLKSIGLPWTMMGRLDSSPMWLFDKMVDSGCVGMRFGVETFNHQILNNINKGIERINFEKVIKTISDKYPELMIRLFMMYGLPNQTEKIHQRDLQILQDLGFQENGNILRQYQMAKCIIFPGTEIFTRSNKTRREETL
jgi:anaerobic magnesium-protoporphyrin IX monomethyl ester cyclase